MQLANSAFQYGKDYFENYIKQYGLDSSRRDLLTKVLSVKPSTRELTLTDRETYMEVSISILPVLVGIRVAVPPL